MLKKMQSFLFLNMGEIEDDVSTENIYERKMARGQNNVAGNTRKRIAKFSQILVNPTLFKF